MLIVTKASKEAATPPPLLLPFHGLFAKMWHNSRDTHDRERWHEALGGLQIFGLPDLSSRRYGTALFGRTDNKF